MSPLIHVGTYARNGGAGLHLLRLSAVGDWTVGEAHAEAQNASFGAYSAEHSLYYFVDEQAEGAIGVFCEAVRGLERVARMLTRGREPCYVGLNQAGSLLAAANYGSGSIAVFRLDDETGLPLGPPIRRQNAGTGPVASRQDGPHAHCVCFSPDGRWLYHVDLGTDEVLGYPVDSAAKTLGERSVAYRAVPGSGPRHLVFHPVRSSALLASELASSLSLVELDGGGFVEKQTASTLPPGYAGESLAGQVLLNAAGDRVYVTNRGHDSVAVFAWDSAAGLELQQHAPSGGKSPRSMVLLEAERQLLVANEESGTIAAFDIGEDGNLSPRAEGIRVPGAAFLLAAPPSTPARP
jgi:6-phosphogluconolactonase